MITKGLGMAVEILLHDTIVRGQDLVLSKEPTEDGKNEIIAQKKKELIALIRAEAINLADSLIGKDKVMQGELDLKEGVARLDPCDKAVYDFQVKQRIALAEYQNPQNGPTGPVIDPELSENEA